MRKILITGGAGFIGSGLAHRLISDPDNYVVLVDNMLTGHQSRISKIDSENWKFIKCDVNNPIDITAVMSSYHFDYVFHYAAVVGVQRTLKNPVMVLNDIEGISNILNLSKNTGVKRVFFASSSEVYGEPEEHPQNEHTTPLNSRLPYAVVKNVGEAFCRSYKFEFDLDYTIFRFFNTYGPMQSTDFVMSKFIRAALRNEDITIFGDGSQSRTFCHIDDNVEATVSCLYNDLLINDTVNVGNDIEYPIIQLAEIIIDVLNSKSRIVHLPALEEGDMGRRKPDISKMRTILDRDLIPLHVGIKRVVEEGGFKMKKEFVTI